ncbi:MAG TPA: YdeI/OmpD-associated family protein [Alphaproteobacteria bacterium]
MTAKNISAGVVHDLPADLRKVLMSHTKMLDQWEDITPLARNEFICWIIDAKKPETRAKRIDVARDKLERGERRPCCWPGCKHR